MKVTVAALSALAVLSALTPSQTMAQGNPNGLPNSLNVTVTNTPLPVTGTVSGAVGITGTVKTQDAGSASPFEGICNANFFTDHASCRVTVPEGHQLVVQLITAQVAVTPGNFPVRLGVQQVKDGGSSGGHLFPLQKTGLYGFTGNDLFLAAQSLTWYLDPAASGVNCYANTSTGAGSSNSLICTVAGYLIKK